MRKAKENQSKTQKEYDIIQRILEMYRVICYIREKVLEFSAASN